MSSKKNETEYLYAASFVHAKEKELLTREKYDRLADCRDESEFIRLLAEYGYHMPKESGFEATLEKILAARMNETESISPFPKNFRIMRLPYDCMNIKAAIKCVIKPEFDFKSLASPCGSVPVSEYEAIMEKRDFSAFTPSLAAAAEEASDIYSKTKDPQLLDITVDKACFLDMNTLAQNSGDRMYIDYAARKTDFANIMILIRCLRMSKPYLFLENVLLPGGTLGKNYFKEIYDGGYETVFSSISKSLYGKELSSVSSVMSSANIDTALSRSMINFAAEIRKSVFGSGALIGFILLSENEIKNIRIIYSAKKEGLDARRVRERISYV